jgi:hypothetical protein
MYLFTRLVFLVKIQISNKSIIYSFELQIIDTRKIPCRFFHLKYYCIEGNQCRFSHEPISAEEHRALFDQV